MADTRLYRLATAFRDSGLWNRRAEVDMFALGFPDGETCYCAVSGDSAEQCALNVYLGEPAQEGPLSVREAGKALLKYGVSCSFEESGRDKGCLEPVFRGREGSTPYLLRSGDGEVRIALALAAAIEIARRLGEGFELESGASRERIVLLSRKESAFVWGTTRRPVYSSEVFETAPLLDELTCARIMRAGENAGTTLLCDVRLSLRPKPGEPPFFPLVLILMDQNGTLEDICHSDRLNGLAPLVDSLIDYILGSGRPGVFAPLSGRAQVLFSGICAQIGLLMKHLSGEISWEGIYL